jgi:hypothetical protein
MRNLLLHSWNVNLDYGLRLVDDLSGQLMVHQPSPGMNHPAWVLCHLCHYHPAIQALAAGEPCPDPAQHLDAPRFDEGSMPAPDPTQYPDKAELVGRFRQGHGEIAVAVERMNIERLNEPVSLERWRPLFGTTGVALAYLMLTHESGHLGQVSAWRRAQGLPRV